MEDRLFRCCGGDAELNKGELAPGVCRRLGSPQEMNCRWRTKYGLMEPLQAKQLQEMQKKNARLKRLFGEPS